MMFLVAILITIFLPLESPSVTVFVFHAGDKVRMNTECSPFKFFHDVCKSTGTVIDFEDGKNRCYPNLKYLVKFETKTGTSSHELCANELEPIKEEK